MPRPDPVLGEVGVAVLVPRAGFVAPDAGALRAFLTGRIAGYKMPVEVRVVDELPLTSVHKLDRGRLIRDLATP